MKTMQELTTESETINANPDESRGDMNVSERDAHGNTPRQILGQESREWRRSVGGMWDEIGKLQFEFLIAKGLKPEHRLLDMGCGCLRGGVYFVRYLDNGNYFGIDMDESLLDAGRTTELFDAGLSNRSVNLSCRDDFVAYDFGVTFDFVLAQSVFTHLPWNSILRCLLEVKRVLAPGGQFFATFLEDPSSSYGTKEIVHTPGGITTYPDRDPYHYAFTVFRELAQRTNLEVEYIGDWNHPRNQMMMNFRHRVMGVV